MLGKMRGLAGLCLYRVYHVPDAVTDAGVVRGRERRPQRCHPDLMDVERFAPALLEGLDLQVLLGNLPQLAQPLVPLVPVSAVDVGPAKLRDEFIHPLVRPTDRSCQRLEHAVER